MKKDNYLIAILGKSASGKDTIARILCKEHGYINVVSTTTRPVRSNETNHEDYHFVTEAEFADLQADDKFIEYRYYDTIEKGKNVRWKYGIEKSAIDLSKGDYVTVVDTVGLVDLKEAYGASVISIYIDVPEESRKARAIGRDANFEYEEFKRRNADDEIKFEGVESNVNAVILNENLDECIDNVLYRIKHQKDMREFFEVYSIY